MLVYPLSPSNVVGEKYRSTPRQSSKITPAAKVRRDSVQFSAPALVKSLGLQGLTPSQIAYKMGLPIATVIDHLAVSFRL